MTSLEEIRDLLKQFTAGKIQTFPATVVSVDEDALTCIVKPGSDPELKARLKSAVDSKPGQYVLIPAVGSTVLVSIIGNDPEKAFVTCFGEIDKMKVVIGDHSFAMTAEGFVFNGGDNGGLIIIQQLINEYNKTKEVVDAIADTLLNWTVTPTDGGAALKVAAGIALAGKATGSFDSITNDNVKH